MLETLNLINDLATAIETDDSDRIIVLGARLARRLAAANPDHANTYAVVAALTRAIAADTRRDLLMRLVDPARPVACA